MKNDLYIVGTGGLAKEIAAVLKKSNLASYNFLGYISENTDEIGGWLGQNQIVGSDDKLPFYNGEQVSVIIGVGDVTTRKKVTEKYTCIPNIEFPNVIDVSCNIDDSNSLGLGNIFFYGSFISVNVDIGDFNLINWYVTIGHDVKVGSYCIINPHAHLSGQTIIGDAVLIGASATVVEKNSVCDESKIGAGAIVVNHITKKGTYVGVPARLTSENRD